MPNVQTPSHASKSLVLVIGAGASKEVNLPTGDELKNYIAQALNFRIEGPYRATGGDSQIIKALHQLAQSVSGRLADIDHYLNAAKRIRDAMPQAPSIDNFIDSHRGDAHIAECGKLAIASCILKAEQQSLLRVDRSNIYNKINFIGVKDTWFNRLFQLIAENCDRNELAARVEKVAVISFNYDRCLEHFLHQSFQNYYALSPDEATALIRRLAIYHPYGTVGPLPWDGGTSSIEYGGQPHSQQLNVLARKLKTFTEGTDENSSDIVEIRSTLGAAKRVVFLGFAFHPLNMDLLYGPEGSSVSQRDDPVYATALEFSESNARWAAIDLARLGRYRVENVFLRRELTASKLLSEYSRSLALRY